jgi:hypothetical protein
MRLYTVLITLAALGWAGPAAGSAPASGKAGDGPAWTEVVVAGVKARARASTTLRGPKDRYGVKNLFDGELATAWVEGAEGDGEGEWVELEFAAPTRIDGYLIAPGYGKSAEVFRDNQVPRRVRIEADGAELAVHDIRYAQTLDGQLSDSDLWGPRVVVLPKPITASRLRLTILEVVRRTRARYRDLAISEWMPILAGKGVVAPVPWEALVSFEVELLRGLRSGAFADRHLAPELVIREPKDPGQHPEFNGGVQEYTVSRPDETTRRGYERFVSEALLGGAVVATRWKGGWLLVSERVGQIGSERVAVLESFAFLRVSDPVLAPPPRVLELGTIQSPPRWHGDRLPDLPDRP